MYCVGEEASSNITYSQNLAETMRYIIPSIGLLALGFLKALSEYKNHKRFKKHQKLMPWIQLTDGGHVNKLEKFGEYVVRQIGLTTPDDYSHFCKLAEEYLKGDKSTSDQSQDRIYLYLSMMCPDEDIKPLYTQLIHELDNCILSYFAFHWEHSTFVINQVLKGNSHPRNKLRTFIFSVTRKQRFERVMKSLKPKQVFSTLLHQIRAIGHHPKIPTDIVVPADANVRSPVLLLIGGGMGVGKSTVVKDILKSCFWSSAAKNAILVEADAFKEKDVVYQALNSSGHDDMLETAELVHQASTDAASSLLVTALNKGRDVIFDGTLSWEPFVLQTIAMARDVHHRKYRMGPGYWVDDDGSVHENYWEPVEDTNIVDGAQMIQNIIEDNGIILPSEASAMVAGGVSLLNVRKPYRIELVGVICDALLAVVRGVRRAIMTKRAVRVKAQLNSIKRFAAALPKYSEVVDHVKVYDTNNIGGPAEIIGWKEDSSKLLVNPDAIKALTKLGSLNENARSVYELYNSMNDENELDKVWKDNVLSSERGPRQQRLQEIIKMVEHHSNLAMKNASNLTSSSFSSSSSSDYGRQSSFDSITSDFSRHASSDGQENTKETGDPDSFSDPKTAIPDFPLDLLDGFALMGNSMLSV